MEAAFHLNDRFTRLAPGAQRHEATREAILSLLEVFPGALDPVDDYPAYSVRRLLLAMVAALETPSR